MGRSERRHVASRSPTVRRVHAPLTREFGQAIVEFALALPVFLVLVFGSIDFGRAVFDLNTITNGARQGARYGIISPNDLTGITNKVNAVAGPIGSGTTVTTSCQLADNTGSVACSSANPGDMIKVTATYRYVPIAGYIVQYVGNGITLTTSSQMVIQ